MIQLALKSFMADKTASGKGFFLITIYAMAYLVITEMINAEGRNTKVK